MKNWKIATAGTAFCAVLILCSGASAGVSKANKPDKKPPKPQPVENQVLVSFKKNASASEKAALHNKAQGNVIKKLQKIGIELVEVPDGTVSDAIKAYKNNPKVAFAEPNYRRTLTTAEGSLPAPYNVSNNFTEQWHLDNTGQGFGAECMLDLLTFEYICDAPIYLGAPDADIDAPEGWALTHGSPDIKIAVLDSGVDCSHPDLDGKCIEQVNFTVSSTPTDLVGHGTHVASIAAAKTDNGIGTAGVAWEAKIGSLKVCYELTDPLLGVYGSYCDDADVIEAITYAADNGYQVINMSLAGPDNSAAIEAAVNYAWENGAVVVAGAGNNYDTVKQYPAACEHVIGVAATDHYDNLSSFSTFGNDWVSVAAPGGGSPSPVDGKGTILAAVPAEYCEGSSDCYDWKSGTSMATPVVSGIAAMVWSYIADPTNAAVRECIETSAQKSGALGQDFLAWTKYGRVNLHDALACDSQPVNEIPIALFNSASAGLTVDFTGHSTDSDGTITSWNWDFGNGDTSTEQNPTHSYAAEGTYTVKLTVMDNAGASSVEFSSDVTVSQLCADTDGDGVPDANDECPDTPANTPVNSNGCPAKPKVVVIPLL